MPISTITQVLLRLFALNWFLSGMISLAVTLHIILKPHAFGSLIPSFVHIFAGILFWILAPAISRIVAKRNDGELSLTGVTEEQLFATAMLGLGVYFSLKSFGEVFNWAHFFAIHKSPDYGFHKENSPSFYDFTEPALTLAAGLVLVFSAKRWAAMLTKNRNSEARSPNPAPRA